MDARFSMRLAVGFGVVVPLLQLCRAGAEFPWRRPALWPIALDAYVFGALLLVGAWRASRVPSDRVPLAIGWAFAAGILYRSLFEHVAEFADRTEPLSLLVAIIKALLLATCALGLVTVLRPAPPAP
jgi:hypothetical protein